MKGFCLEVTGEFACFTRPEMKVERVSYDVITPSAARGIFSAILWKPAICWHITQIDVLAPIRWASVRRNEVSKVASARSSGIVVDDCRQQRAALILRDVRYRLHAEFEFIPLEKRPKVSNPVPEWLKDSDQKAEERNDETEAKYAAMFERRAKKGQCFNQPYLGCREFSCSFRLVPTEEDKVIPEELRINRDLGWMLYDMDFSNGPADIRPMFYRAEIKDGSIRVPCENSEEVVK